MAFVSISGIFTQGWRMGINELKTVTLQSGITLKRLSLSDWPRQGLGQPFLAASHQHIVEQRCTPLAPRRATGYALGTDRKTT
jgi:hypothetical protein